MDNFHAHQAHPFLHKPIPLLLNTSTSPTSAPVSNPANTLNTQLTLNWHQQLSAVAAAAAAAAAVASSSTAHSSSFIAFAGSEINVDSKVYLLYDVPMALLAKRFHDLDKIDDKIRILVGF